MDSAHQQNKSDSAHGEYFLHIDGIRTLAVLPVILYHLSGNFCPGGYAGVDVFFVISGYLIIGGIVRNLSSGSFSFASFYYRRAKRIIPAYFIMISATLLVGLLWYSYRPFYDLGSAVLRSSFFAANHYFYKFTSGYFAQSGESHPLLNIWSLSVEEQFYIIIPLMIWAVWKLGKKRMVFTLLACMAGASFLYSAYLMHEDSPRAHSAAFFLLQSRAWELLAGGGLALLPAMKNRNKRRTFSALAGLVLICYPYIFYSSRTLFPGMAALPSIVGTSLLLRYGMAGRVGCFLSMKSVVGIGKISYSLYLWHWPIIVFWKYYRGEILDGRDYGGILLLSFIMAFLSWKYVEVPCRTNRFFTKKKILWGTLAICSILAVSGGIIYQTHGGQSWLHPTANKYASLEYPPQLQVFEPSFNVEQPDQFKDNKGKVCRQPLRWLGSAAYPPSFVLIGDSHAEAVALGLDAACRRHAASGVYINLKTCPLWDVQEVNGFSNIARPFVEWLRNSPPIETVVMECRWATRCESGPRDHILYRTGEDIPADGSRNHILFEEGLRETCRRIRILGRRVVLLGPIPELHGDPGEEIRRNIMTGHAEKRHQVTRDEFLTRQKNVLEILFRLKREEHVDVILLHEMLEHDGIYQGLRHDRLLYHDSHHLSGEGAKYISPVLEKIFLLHSS